MKMFGEEITVAAKIVNFTGLSSHADRDHLIAWISAAQNPKPQHVFVVHGDREVAPFFAQTLVGMGLEAHAVQYTEEYDLITCKQMGTGYLPERKTRAAEGAPKSEPTYDRLVSVGSMMSELIKRSRGRDNKSLASFADQLKKLLEKWDI